MKNRSRKSSNKKLKAMVFVATILLVLIIVLVIFSLVKKNQEKKAEEESRRIEEQAKAIQATAETTTSIPPEAVGADSYFYTSKGFLAVVKEGVTYIDGQLIANKTYALPETYGAGLTAETQEAFNRMAADASAQGLNIYIASGFRSYDHQYNLYNNYVARDGQEAADTYSARPGHSEHQSGLAFDVNSVDYSFNDTAESVWLSGNCWRYGFILRYPLGKNHETGYIYESWHFRYLGDTALCEKLWNGGEWLTLEDYYGITSEYAG